jgi:hypothetical protein
LRVCVSSPAAFVVIGVGGPIVVGGMLAGPVLVGVVMFELAGCVASPAGAVVVVGVEVCGGATAVGAAAPGVAVCVEVGVAVCVGIVAAGAAARVRCALAQVAQLNKRNRTDSRIMYESSKAYTDG